MTQDVSCKILIIGMITIRNFNILGDPCSISCQEELNEAIRLFDVNKEAQLILHGELFFNSIYMH